MIRLLVRRRVLASTSMSGQVAAVVPGGLGQHGGGQLGGVGLCLFQYYRAA